VSQLDVTEILYDPDFTDEMCLVDRVPAINSLGENTLKEVSVNTVGSVQPASGRVIQRLPEALRVANVSSFWIKGTITAAAPGKYSSVIVFKGQRYLIQMVFDFTNWGAGFCEGVCVAEVPA
jgi:hypothetical protein